MPTNQFVTSSLVKRAIFLYSKLSTYFRTGYKATGSANPYGGEGPYSVGSTFHQRMNSNIDLQEGDVVTASNMVDRTYPVIVQLKQNTAFNYDQAKWLYSQGALDTEAKQDKILEPSMRKIASKSDILCAKALHNKVFNFVGIPGTSLSSWDAFDQARAFSEDLCWDDKLYLAITNTQKSKLMGFFQNNFNLKQVGKILASGTLENLSGYSGIFGTTHNPNHVSELPPAITCTVTNNIPDGATTIDLTFTDTAANGKKLLVGDLISIDVVSKGVYPLNENGDELTERQLQLRVTEDSAVIAALVVTGVKIDPAIIYTRAKAVSTHANENVSGQVVAGTPGYVVGNYKSNFVYTPKALYICPMQMKKLSNVVGAMYTDPDSGISMRIGMQGDIKSDQEFTRVYTQFAIGIDKRLAIRVLT